MIWKLEAQLEVKEVEIAELKKTAEMQKVRHKRTTNILQDSMERTEKELRNTTEQLQNQLKTKNEEIAELKKQLSKLSAKHTNSQKSAITHATDDTSPVLPSPSNTWSSPPPAPPAFKISTYTTDREIQPIKRPVDTRSEPLPFRVFDVAGSKRITGTHISRQFVETDDTYRDEFGNKKKHGEWEKETVKEYGYKVTFSVENPTDQDETIIARAGLVDKVLFLRAGQSQKGIVLNAAKGSSLIVGVGGRQKRFNVTY